MVAMALPPPTVVNPPVAKPVVAIIMAALTVVAVRTTVAANDPSVKNCNYWGHVAPDCRNWFNPKF
jgi:hypothetical protein